MSAGRFWSVFAVSVAFGLTLCLLLVVLIGTIAQPREQHCMTIQHNDRQSEARCIQR